MVSFDSLAIGTQFTIDGIAVVFTKETGLLARGAIGEWIADDTFMNPFANSMMVTPVP
jgi:hypothetical protein